MAGNQSNMNVGMLKHKRREWQPAAVGIAWVSGVFSLIVACFLIFNTAVSQLSQADKEQLFSPALVETKQRLAVEPNNDELKQEIRTLDLELREAYFQRKAFADYGKYLLWAGLALFLLSVKKAADFQKTLPMPSVAENEAKREQARRGESRHAVGIYGALAAAGVLALACIPAVDFPQALLDDSAIVAAQVETFPTRAEIEQNWPRFRGSRGLGVYHGAPLPLAWNEETNQGILWKIETLLPGHNSPIVWGDRVFLSGATETEKEIYCYAAATGDLLWKKPIENVPPNPGEQPNLFEGTGFAASTMACDGFRVYAIFADGVLAAFDLDGGQAWVKHLGTPDSVYGFATSLATYENLLLVQYDQGGVDDGISALFAYDGKTGALAWQKSRPVANTWTTPMVAETASGEQLITCSEPWVIAYHPKTGEEIWRADLMGADLAPSPVFGGGLVLVTQPNEIIFAIKPDGAGDVTETHIVWELDYPAPDTSSPVCNDELLFLLASSGYLSCHDMKTGEMIWEHDFMESFQASPVLAGDWLYAMSEEGHTFRVKASREFEQGEVSALHDKFTASPAVKDGRLFARGVASLYCIGDK